jgi:hypothetical protein
MVLVDVIEHDQEGEKKAAAMTMKLHWFAFLFLSLISFLWFVLDLPGRDGVHVSLILSFPFWGWWVFKGGLLRTVGSVFTLFCSASWVGLIWLLAASENQAIPVYIGIPVDAEVTSGKVDHVLARINRGPLNTEVEVQIFQSPSRDWFQTSGGVELNSTRWIYLPWSPSHGIQGRVQLLPLSNEGLGKVFRSTPVWERNIAKQRKAADHDRENLDRQDLTGDFRRIEESKLRLERSLRELAEFKSSNGSRRISWFTIRNLRSNFEVDDSYLADFSWFSMSWDELGAENMLPNDKTAISKGFLRYKATLVFGAPVSILPETVGDEKRHRLRKSREGGYPSEL